MSDEKVQLERRTFLKLAGLTGAGALAGCAAPPAERVFSYVSPPDDQRLGIATWYASTCRECPAGCGILVRTREGRAVKIEGNPAHPVNRGTLCSRGQAALQGLYNPDRVPTPRQNQGGNWSDVSWDDGIARLTERVQAAAGKPGAIQFWTSSGTGAFSAFVDEFCAATKAERVRYEAFDDAPVREAARQVFGTSTIPVFDVSQAKFILSLGADFLDTWGLPLQQARGYDFAHSAKEGIHAKHVQVEPRLSLTGHSADQWISIRPGTEALFALGLAQLLGAGVTGYDAATVAEACGIEATKLTALADELRAHAPVVVFGPGAAATGTNATEAWIATFLLNRALGAVGTTVLPTPGFDPGPTSSFAEVQAALARLQSGAVQVLLVHEVNPAYSLTGRGGFAESAAQAGFKVSFGSYPDETMMLCDLALPDHHPLESWDTAEPAPGVHSLRQPVMRPVFQTRQTGDVLLAVAGGVGGASARLADASFREYVERRWGGTVAQFRAAQQRGGEFPAELPGGGAPSRWNGSLETAGVAFDGTGDLALYVYPHPFFYDGRGANKPWFQEVADPITKIVWDNWCELHPETAARLGLAKHDLALIETPLGKIELPVYVHEMIHPEVIAIPLGQGHTAYGDYAKGRGANAFELLGGATDARSGGRAFSSLKAKVTPTGRQHRLVRPSETMEQHGRGIAQAIPLALVATGAVAGAAAPNGYGHGANGPASGGHGEANGADGGHGGAHAGLVFPNYRDKTEQLDGFKAKPMDPAQLPPTGSSQYNRTNKRWGMAIDLSSCIGCNACVVACYSENNIAIVGKENITRGRDMGWMRIERYYEETSDGKEARFVPMLCQHCENAPCEPVCPVYATYHNPEGLNVQVYNRCVGTRYCSNNCSYKVRAFNWFEYEWRSPLNWQLNPDITTRSKGVMEKCTFCIQRIQRARTVARDEDRDIRDGEVTPACAQGCPTQAIVFGDLHDPDSKVAKLSAQERGYKVLGELNTLPGITYLKKVSRRAADETHAGGAVHGEA